jgi:large subunit ribosomal protein L30
MATEKTIRIRQVGSPIRRDKKQALYLRSLGLRGIGSERVLSANNTVLSLLKRVRHMVIEIAGSIKGAPARPATRNATSSGVAKAVQGAESNTESTSVKSDEAKDASKRATESVVNAQGAPGGADVQTSEPKVGTIAESDVKSASAEHDEVSTQVARSGAATTDEDARKLATDTTSSMKSET